LPEVSRRELNSSTAKMSGGVQAQPRLGARAAARFAAARLRESRACFNKMAGKS
jgi:hypothetical protein